MNNWRIAYHREWLDKHPEFNQQCKTREQLDELQQVCMAYIRKLLRSGEVGKLPYDKHERIADKPACNEQELLSQFPKSESLFEDLHDKSICP